MAHFARRDSGLLRRSALGSALGFKVASNCSEVADTLARTALPEASAERPSGGVRRSGVELKLTLLAPYLDSATQALQRA